MARKTNVSLMLETVINRVLVDSGRPARQLSNDDALMETIGLDSLDLAVTVVNLEQELGVDPFRSGASGARTFGELVTLYQRALDDSQTRKDPADE